MRHDPVLGSVGGAHYFFTTSPLPCPYFADRAEKRVITELAGKDAQALHEALTRAGYRRSHGIAYAPACPSCNDCVAVRIRAADFQPSRTQRKILKRNQDLDVAERPPEANQEQFVLFSDYQTSRHSGGDMETMAFSDYQSLLEDNCIDTALLEFRLEGRLVGGLIVDRLTDGYSAVYSFFDSQMDGRRSLGTFMILWLARQTQLKGLDHVYLGFWIDGCRKMRYKTDFRPLEYFSRRGWRREFEKES